MQGFGTDIVEIARLKHWKDDTDMLSFVFCQTERDAAMGRKCGHRHLATAFAVKEAFMKAVGTGWGSGIQWKDIETFYEDRRVAVRLHNRAKELCGNRKVFVSAGCSRDLAIAVVAIGKNPGSFVSALTNQANVDPF
jgi:holo-[acyl-carrier protein] synthase